MFVQSTLILNHLSVSVISMMFVPNYSSVWLEKPNWSSFSRRFPVQLPRVGGLCWRRLYDSFCMTYINYLIHYRSTIPLLIINYEWEHRRQKMRIEYTRLRDIECSLIIWNKSSILPFSIFSYQHTITPLGTMQLWWIETQTK